MIGIAGNATVGKDSFYIILRNYLEENGIRCARLALADNLKNESRHEIYEKIGISTFTNKPEDKVKVRPYLVEFANRKRKETQGQYFTSKLETELDIARKLGIIPIITDIRFDEYPDDELTWLKNKHKGQLVYIDRLDNLNKPIGPVNQSEEENNIKLKSAADYYVIWPTLDEKNRLNYIKEHHSNVLTSLLRYCKTI